MAINKNNIINPATRIQIFRGIVIFLLSCLCLRLWFLQCFYGTYYRDKSENNRIRTVKLIAPRGRILDRNNNILVRSRPSFNVGIMLEDVEKPEFSLAEVAKFSGIDAGIIFDNFKRNKNFRRFEPRIILEDVSSEQFTKLKANSYRLPGITFDIVPTRLYPHIQTASQIFGYVREITKQQLAELEGKEYKIGDMIGQTGIEKSYESILRGYSGFIQLEVDAKGVKKQEIGSVPYKTGRDIMLSLDIDLQKVAEEALGDKRGAAVALDPSNGEVLVLASTPTFDANIFSGQLLTSNWDKIIKDPARPMVNRGISTAYPLGSTSKLIWSVAGLNEKIITPTSHIHCPGFYRLGNRRYLCNKPSGHGSLDLKTAFMVSCNAYYYSLGQTLGIERMSKYLDYFGFGLRTGIDLLGEETGTSPNPQWKMVRFKQKWYPGDTVPVSIGQGYFIATPIQLAQAAAAVSNGGKLFKPRLVKSNSVSGEDNTMVPSPVNLKNDLVAEGLVSKESLNEMREISALVVEGERGTAKAARLPGIRVGGKTGTAQVVGRLKDQGTKKTEDHAWFVGYAPVENPQIVVAVIVENSGHGGEFAAPIVRQIMYRYFDKLGMIDHSIEESLNIKNKNKHKEIKKDIGAPNYNNEESEEFIEEVDSLEMDNQSGIESMEESIIDQREE